MIDTIRLNLTDCDIKPTSPIVVQSAALDHSTGKKLNEYDLFINNSGRIVRGSKAFLNDDKFNLTINPSMVSETDNYTTSFKPKNFKRIVPDKDLWDYNFSGEDEMTGIYLQTSLPRLIGENNLNTLSLDETKKAFKILESRLKKYGIATNILNSNLSRLDTFTNISTDLNFFSYTSLFSVMDCSRMKSVGYGDQSYLWKNGQQELMIYDKVTEMKTKFPDLKFRKKNIMRFENRLLKKRKILSKFRFKTTRELLNNFQDVKEFHRSEIENKIFKYSFDEIQKLTDDDLKEKFINAKKFYGKRWFNGYCFAFGAFQLSRLTSYEHLEQIIEEIEGGNDPKVRMKKMRMRKSLREAKLYFNIAENRPSKFRSNIELYNELKTKFYRQAA